MYTYRKRSHTSVWARGHIIICINCIYSRIGRLHESLNDLIRSLAIVIAKCVFLRPAVHLYYNIIVSATPPFDFDFFFSITNARSEGARDPIDARATLVIFIIIIIIMIMYIHRPLASSWTAIMYVRCMPLVPVGLIIVVILFFPHTRTVEQK